MKNILSKITILVLTLTLVFSLSSCGNKVTYSDIEDAEGITLLNKCQENMVKTIDIKDNMQIKGDVKVDASNKSVENGKPITENAKIDANIGVTIHTEEGITTSSSVLSMTTSSKEGTAANGISMYNINKGDKYYNYLATISKQKLGKEPEVDNSEYDYSEVTKEESLELYNNIKSTYNEYLTSLNTTIDPSVIEALEEDEFVVSLGSDGSYIIKLNIVEETAKTETEPKKTSKYSFKVYISKAGYITKMTAKITQLEDDKEITKADASINVSYSNKMLSKVSINADVVSDTGTAKVSGAVTISYKSAKVVVPNEDKYTLTTYA